MERHDMQIKEGAMDWLLCGGLLINGMGNSRSDQELQSFLSYLNGRGEKGERVV